MSEKEGFWKLVRKGYRSMKEDFEPPKSKPEEAAPAEAIQEPEHEAPVQHEREEAPPVQAEAAAQPEPQAREEPVAEQAPPSEAAAAEPEAPSEPSTGMAARPEPRQGEAAPYFVPASDIDEEEPEEEPKPKKKSIAAFIKPASRRDEDLDDGVSELTVKKRRFRLIVAFGIVMSIVAFLISISISAGGIVPINEAIASMISAIAKGGENLNTVELYIFQSRLPRAIAAIGVGAGLAVAGCMYQAIIRNPLVDPYITGVSSGAGCFAVAVVALGVSIPFIGDNTLYIIPVAAIVGGLIAFGITMGVAEGSGGSASNYILAGVIVGFALSSVQTVFLSMAKDNLSNAMWWLYGSFANITWENAWIVMIPALGIALLAMVWAREFNLFMMGEDQAKQLGMNVKRFKRTMMIIASVLTAICVAFCGIIGFVGLIIPHACRMALGTDHRLIMPASIVLGACLMLFSDLIARTVMSPLELPVGAITAMIGTPIFAYMLVKRGREYDG
jgi:iron complex transport system permease protein